MTRDTKGDGLVQQQSRVEVVFRAPSLKRLRALLKDTKTLSVLRALEYERLSRLELRGHVLDFGGGEVSNYSHLVSSWGSRDGFVYESVNIDPATKPTYLIKPGEPLPCDNERFDAAISLNTLEHVYDVAGALHEIHRVLRPGATFTFIVPFVFRVHGHPDDYTRGTPSYWTRRLRDSGYEPKSIEALTWGPFSTGAVISGLPGPLKRLRLCMALGLDLLHAAARRGTRGGAALALSQDDPLCSTAMGYLVEAGRI